MAENPYVNKVEYAGQTLMDLTGDTVTPSDVLNGTTFHDRSGAPQTGNLITHDVYDGLDSTSTSDALSAKQGKVICDEMAPQSLTCTWTSNIYVTENDFNGWITANRRSGLNTCWGNMWVRNPNNASNVSAEIGRITGWSSCDAYREQIKTSGNNASTVTVNISKTGVITIMWESSITAGWYRFTATAMRSDYVGVNPGNVNTYNVYDDLDSSSTIDALSANQGRILNNKFQNYIPTQTSSLTNGTDLNTVFDNGIWLLPNDAGYSYPNDPLSGSAAILMVFKTDTVTTQILIPYSAASNYYIRKALNSTWGLWSEIFVKKSDIGKWANIDSGELSFTTSFAYLGKSFTIASPMLVRFIVSYNNTYPTAIGIKATTSDYSQILGCSYLDKSIVSTKCTGNAVTVALDAGTYYLWGMAQDAAKNNYSVDGISFK